MSQNKIFCPTNKKEQGGEKKESLNSNTKTKRRMNWSTVFAIRAILLISLIAIVLPALIVSISTKNEGVTLFLFLGASIILFIILKGKQWLRGL